MGIERAIALLSWKGRSLFWDRKGDRFFYESRDRYRVNFSIVQFNYVA